MHSSRLRKMAILLCVFALPMISCSMNTLNEFVSTVFAAAAVEPATDDGLEATIRAVISDNLRAAEDEDLEAYMLSIHPDSPGYAQTESAMETAFDGYDIDYEVEIGEISLLDSGDVSAAFVLTTLKIRGGAFRDNVITGVFFLRQDGSEWKIYSQEYTNIRYLN